MAPSIFVHHVFFWLKDPDSQSDLEALIAGLQRLSGISVIREFHIGRPAGTSRDVIETSYSVSWLLFFDTAAGQDSYQEDPIHLQFVKDCSPLWRKVLVYDSVDR
jgi:Stress responsive A/B Barrel Domain